MTIKELISYRLFNQHITAPHVNTPQEIVSRLGAMQAQDFAMAKWAIGLRLHGKVNEKDLQEAFDKGDILRTHIMRPTWHFVAPQDIRCLLSLCGPRVIQANASMAKKIGLNRKIFTKAIDILIKSLEGNNFLTRDELRVELERKMKVGDGQRLAYIMMQAEQEAIIVSGPRKGKQFTYALLDERAPKTKSISRDEALARLTERYFASRAPATEYDFAAWSGLTLADVRKGITELPKDFCRITVDDTEYIYQPKEVARRDTHLMTFLMPDFDEYGIAYKDKSALQSATPVSFWRNNVTQSGHWLIVDGLIQGTWDKDTVRNTTRVTTTVFSDMTKTQLRKITRAVKNYEEYINS